MYLLNANGKYKKILTRLPFYISALIIGACGGGGSESDTNTPPPAQAIVEEEASKDPIADLNALIIDDDFSFTSKQEITFTLSLPSYADERAYVTLYGDYRQLPSGEYYPIPESRILSGSLTQGQFQQFFTGLSEQQYYLAEVWLYDLSPPLQKELVVNDNKLDW